VYNFSLSGFVHQARGIDETEQKTLKMTLMARPERCVSFDCTRRPVGEGVPIRTQVRSAGLFLVKGDGSTTQILRTHVSDPTDSEIEVICPDSAKGPFRDLEYPINRIDVANALGGLADGSKVEPIEAKFLVEMDVYVFERSGRVKVGTIVSTPFLVRVSNTVFEIRSD
jgi:hypothetical protein